MKKKYVLGSVLMALLMLLTTMGTMNSIATSSTVTYYFDRQDNSNSWETYPEKMVDGNEEEFALTTINGDTQLCNHNNCTSPPTGNITKVEIRAKVYASSTGHKIDLKPIFLGTPSDYTYSSDVPTEQDWTEWHDITNDNGAPETWNWTSIQNLDVLVKAKFSSGGTPTMGCSMVQLRVTYT